MSQAVKRFFLAASLVLIALSSSCNQITIKNLEELPAPAEAKAEAIDGAYEISLDAAINSIYGDLKKDYGVIREKILFLPGDAESEKIFRFYAAHLAAKNFTKDAGVPTENRNYKLNVWRSGNRFAGQAVAVAVVETRTDANGSPLKFLVVFLAE